MTRGGWPAELHDHAWEKHGRDIEPGKLGWWLGPLLLKLTKRYGKHEGLALLKRGFAAWQASPDWHRGPRHFREHFAEYVRGPGI